MKRSSAEKQKSFWNADGPIERVPRGLGRCDIGFGMDRSSANASVINARISSSSIVASSVTGAAGSTSDVERAVGVANANAMLENLREREQ